MNGPKINIPQQPVDQLIEVLGLVSLILLLVLPLFYLDRLPDEIPVKFDLSGRAYAFRSKAHLWIMPAAGLLIFSGLSFLVRFPHRFNYPVRVTDENASRLYRIGTRTISMLKTLLVTMFLYINLNTIYSALGEEPEMGRLVIPGFIIMILLLTGAMIYKMIRNK